MRTLGRLIAATTLAAAPLVPAFASQGPGTSGGTATGLEQVIFAVALIAATVAGLIVLRLRRR